MLNFNPAELTDREEVLTTALPNGYAKSRSKKLCERAILWTLRAAVFAAVLFSSGWAVLALYFAGPGGPAMHLISASVIAALTAAAWVNLLRKRTALVIRGVWSVAVLWTLLWFSSIEPSHKRDWRSEVSVLPRIVADGDQARITGYRDIKYRTRDDFDVRYHERAVDLTKLSGVDLFISYWQDGPMAHTFLSFHFENASPVCVSIEARPERDERFAAVASLFKRYELIYVVGEERDIVGVRARHRGEQVFRYSIRVSAEAARRLFLVYAGKINRLAAEPEFYHLLSNSCTANIIRNAEAAGQRMPLFEGRFILNGWVDRYLHEVGLVDQSMAFEVLREKARITEKAMNATAENFSEEIRQ